MNETIDILKKLSTLRQRRRKLLKTLCQSSELAVGTVTRELRRCGNPKCHCAENPCHEQMIFFYTLNGKRTSTFVRRADEKRFEKASDRYREFKEGLREIKQLNSEERELLLVLKGSRAIDYKKRKR